MSDSCGAICDEKDVHMWKACRTQLPASVPPELGGGGSDSV